MLIIDRFDHQQLRIRFSMVPSILPSQLEILSTGQTYYDIHEAVNADGSRHISNGLSISSMHMSHCATSNMNLVWCHVAGHAIMIADIVAQRQYVHTAWQRFEMHSD